MLTLRSALGGMLLSACGSAQPPASPVPGAAESESVAQPVAPEFALADVRVLGPEGVLFELHADGSVEARGERVGTLSPEGRLVTPDGEVVAELAHTQLSVAGRPVARLEGRVAELNDGSTRFEFGADGLLRTATGPDDDMPVRLEPADSPAATAALMLVLVLML